MSSSNRVSGCKCNFTCRNNQKCFCVQMPQFQTYVVLKVLEKCIYPFRRNMTLLDSTHQLPKLACESPLSHDPHSLYLHGQLHPLVYIPIYLVLTRTISGLNPRRYARFVVTCAYSNLKSFIPDILNIQPIIEVDCNIHKCHSIHIVGVSKCDQEKRLSEVQSCNKTHFSKDLHLTLSKFHISFSVKFLSTGGTHQQL